MYQDSNALTEVALALAMAFFTILVLALVSMGVPREATAEAASEPQRPVSVSLNPGESSRSMEEGEALYLYYRSRFFDASLAEQSLQAVSAEDKVIVAVSPDLPLAQLLALQQQISSPNLSITTLNDEWLKALEQRR